MRSWIKKIGPFGFGGIVIAVASGKIPSWLITPARVSEGWVMQNSVFPVWTAFLTALLLAYLIFLAVDYLSDGRFEKKRESLADIETEGHKLISEKPDPTNSQALEVWGKKTVDWRQLATDQIKKINSADSKRFSLPISPNEFPQGLAVAIPRYQALSGQHHAYLNRLREFVIKYSVRSKRN